MSWSATDMVTALVCRWRGHRWEPFEAGRRDHDRNMRWADRSYCTCCEAHRLVWLASKDTRLPSGEVDVFSRSEVVELSPRWLEALYRARWRDYPRASVKVGGRFPSEWMWDVGGAM